MATLDENFMPVQQSESGSSFAEAMVGTQERVDISQLQGQETKSENFFMRFLRFITGRTRKRPTPVDAEPMTTTNVQTENAESAEGVVGPVTTQEQAEERQEDIVSSVNPAVRDELIANKKQELTRRYIEFVDAQPMVKILVNRNMMSLFLCRNRFERYIGEVSEKAVDIDLRNATDTLEGEELAAAQAARIRERVDILGAETENKVLENMLYENNGDDFLSLIYPRGFTSEIVESRLANSKLKSDSPEAAAFIENFRRNKLFEDNYTEERDNDELARKVGAIMVTRVSMRQEEMTYDVLDQIAGLKGGDLVRGLDKVLEQYNLDMLGKAVLILPNILEQYIEKAGIPFPPLEQVNEAYEEAQQLEKERAENEAIAAISPYDYKEAREEPVRSGLPTIEQVTEMMDVVKGRAEIVSEFVNIFNATAGIEGFSVSKRAPLAVVSDLIPFVLRAGSISIASGDFNQCYSDVMKSHSRRECEAMIIIMFENISRKLPRQTQQVMFRRAQIV